MIVGMWNAAPPLAMTGEQRQTLEAWAWAPNTPQGIALRAKIVLLAADGSANIRVAKELRITRPTVDPVAGAFSGGWCRRPDQDRARPRPASGL